MNMKSSFVVPVGVLLVALPGLCSFASPSAGASVSGEVVSINNQQSELASPGRDQVVRDFDRLPPIFEPNLGQAASGVLYVSRSGGSTLALSRLSALLTIPMKRPARRIVGEHPSYLRSDRFASSSLSMAFVGADPGVALEPGQRMTGEVNYLHGPDSYRWVTNVPTYAGITYRALYPGIDLSFSGAGGALEYTFTVASHADANRIRLRLSGQERLFIERNGQLDIATEAGSIGQPAPTIYQVVGGQRHPLSGGFVLLGPNEVGFRVGPHDPSLPVVIDPILTYSTYLGGTADDVAYAVAVDGSGNAYVTGVTASTDFPVGSGKNHGNLDVFITKMNASGSGFIYSSYLGGSQADEAGAVHVDASGRAYLTGVTNSTNFPTTSGAFQRSFRGGTWDSFLAKLSPAGSSLNYSTYLGGTGDDQGFGVTLDPTGTYPILTGTTRSTNFPVAHAFHSANAGGYDAFVTKINPNPNQALRYSTYLGGSSTDKGFAIALRDSSGRVLVTGLTHSTNFPHTTGAYQTSNKGGNDAFATLVNGGGTTLGYSTYLGGTGLHDAGTGVAADASGAAYLTGFTDSTNFPHTSGAYQTSNKGGYDAFVTKLVPAGGQALAYSTYVGGGGDDSASALALDSSNNVSVVGTTNSTDYPTTSDAVQPTAPGGSYDVVVSELDPTGSSLTSSTYLGGGGDDEGSAIALDSSANVYVAGVTLSEGFPTAGHVFEGEIDQGSESGYYDGFVTSLRPGTPIRSTVGAFGFDVTSMTLSQGDTIQWALNDSNHNFHFVFDGSGMNLFGSGYRELNSIYAYTFGAAGLFTAYCCSAFGGSQEESQEIVVPLIVFPETGHPGTAFDIRWSSGALPKGYVVDVQIRRPGSTAFTDWMTGTSSLGAAFTADAGDGTYQFRSRVRNASTGKSSAYSLPANLTVSGFLVQDSGFTPQRAGSPVGTSQQWVFPSSNAQSHSVTDASGFNLFDSGLQPPGSTFSYTLQAAGSYSVQDTATSHSGTVDALVKVTAAAYPATSFKIAWAAHAPPSGDVFDVQVKKPGSTSYGLWQNGTTLLSAVYKAKRSAEGTYSFRGRLRDPASGLASGWSTATSVTIAGWRQYQDDSARDGRNPTETLITPANVSGLKQGWAVTQGVSSLQPIVADGTIFVTYDGLVALKASNGAPLWSGQSLNSPSTPAVSGSTVFVSRLGGVSAYDARGMTNCSGSPIVCSPIWTGATSGTARSPVDANGMVYVPTDDSHVYAFDASGVSNCSGSPKTCLPLWSAAITAGVEDVAESVGSLFVWGNDGKLSVYDALGSTNCSGSPTTCQPLWTAQAGTFSQSRSGPVVSDGRVYVSTDSGAIFAFDASGVTKCSGSPKVCQPLWLAPITSGYSAAIAAGDGLVYTTDFGGQILALDASTGSPIWFARAQGTFFPAVLANGVLYVDSSDHTVALDAATGALLLDAPFAGVTVVNGAVFALDGTHILAFHP
jgi:outer membrane protein assembly factor BamB/plastocyanin